MLEIKNIYKTFNAGTVNEKRATLMLALGVSQGGHAAKIWPFPES